MKRIIDFDVSVAGLPAQIIRVEYESHYASKEEIMATAYEDDDVMQEAIRMLTKEIGHDDYQVQYWDWIK